MLLLPSLGTFSKYVVVRLGAQSLEMWKVHVFSFIFSSVVSDNGCDNVHDVMR